MEFYKTLENIMLQKGLSIADVARMCDLPDSTVRSIVDRKQKKVALSIAFNLSEGLGVTLESLAGIQTPAEKKKGLLLSNEAMEVAKKYNSLDDHGQKVVSTVLDYEVKRLLDEGQRPAKPMKVIPLLGTSFAAGTTEQESDIPWEDLEVDAESKAEFAIHINGNSMEPYLPDGSIAYGVKRAPQDGEVAALLLDGDFICKQVCQDAYGNLYLFSLNRDRADADQKIMHDAERSVTCFGTIIMDPVPLPQD